MGAFDRYEPSFALACPICKHPLRQWQGKEGPCEQLLWVEGERSPRHVNDEMPRDSARRQFQLPESFSISSFDCPRHRRVDAGCRCESDTWVETSVRWPEPETDTHGVTLRCGDSVVELRPGTWCYVFLESGGRRVRLGVGNRTEVIDGLLGGLLGSLETSPHATSAELSTSRVLSLSEGGASLRFAERDGGRVLLIESASASLLARVDLPPAVVAQWADLLAAER